MDGVAPPLYLLECCVASLENGESLRQGVQKFFRQCSAQEPLGIITARFLFSFDHGQDLSLIYRDIKSPYQRTILQLIELGLKGQPVHDRLKELREEVWEACQLELQDHISTLPLKMLVPVLLLMFPAFLVLLLGPLLKTFLTQLQGAF